MGSRVYPPQRYRLGSWLALGILALAPVPGHGDGPLRLLPLVGESRSVEVAQGDTLVDLAYSHGVGFDPLFRLNPGVKVWVPTPGTRIQLPTRQILPDAARVGLVVNIPELRLYDYTAPGGVAVHAVALGDAVDPSPLGRFQVGEKRLDPIWHVPESIRSKRPELPPRVPPGPGNPLGSRWMRIGDTTYGIHGTNTPWSIGRLATHGCIRLYEAEMRDLYERLPAGTPIELVYQTVKLGTDAGALFVEAHPDIYRLEPGRLAATLARLAGSALHIDVPELRRVIAEERGIPVRVGTLSVSDAPRQVAQNEDAGGT